MTGIGKVFVFTFSFVPRVYLYFCTGYEVKNHKLTKNQAMDNLTNNEKKKQEEEDVVQKLSEMEEELNVHLQP